VSRSSIPPSGFLFIHLSSVLSCVFCLFDGHVLTTLADYIHEDMMNEDTPSPSYSRSGSYDDDDDEDMDWDNDDSSAPSITFAPNVTQETYGGTINPKALAGAAEASDFSFAMSTGGLIFPGDASAEGVSTIGDFIKMLRRKLSFSLGHTTS
jgi:hypothetical protein